MAASSSLPGGGGLDMAAAAAAKAVASSVPATGLTTVSVVNLPPGISGNNACKFGLFCDLVLFHHRYKIYI